MVKIEELGQITICIRNETRKPIAFASLVCHTNWGEIVGLYVDPEYRRQGHGNALALELIKRAKTRGLDEISATTERGDKITQQLFKKLHFSDWHKWVLRL